MPLRNYSVFTHPTGPQDRKHTATARAGLACNYQLICAGLVTVTLNALLARLQISLKPELSNDVCNCNLN